MHAHHPTVLVLAVVVSLGLVGHDASAQEILDEEALAVRHAILSEREFEVVLGLQSLERLLLKGVAPAAFDSLVPRLRELARGQSQLLRRESIALLPKLDALKLDSDALAAVLEAAHDPDGFTRIAAVKALHATEPGNRATVAVLREALRDDDERVQLEAITSLGFVARGFSELQDEISGLVKAADANVRARAIRALAAAEAVQELGVVGDALQDPKLSVRMAAAISLGEFGTIARAWSPSLCRTFFVVPTQNRWVVARSLALLGEWNGSVSEVVEAALKHSEDPVLEVYAAVILAKTGNDQARALAHGTRLLSEPGVPLSAQMRTIAQLIPLLAESFPKETVALLSQVLLSKNENARLAAIRQLSAVGEAAQSALPRLRELLRSSPARRERRTLVNAIEAISNPPPG